MANYASFDGAGFTNVETGLLGKYVPLGTIYNPGGPLVIENSILLWRCDSKNDKHIQPSAVMLDQFIRLWQQDDTAILRFARKWGPLQINRFGNGSYGQESIDAWRYYSRRAYAVLKVAAQIKRGEDVDESEWDWFTVSWDRFRNPTPDALTDKEAKWRCFWRHEMISFHDEDLERVGMKRMGLCLSYRGRCVLPRDHFTGIAPKPPLAVDIPPELTIEAELKSWLERFPVTLMVDWQARFQLTVQYHDFLLLSAIALQLTLTIAGDSNLYNCSGCGEVYTRAQARKKPNPGQNNYCPKCERKGKPLQVADRRRREKMAAARRLHASGVSPTDICHELGVRKVATVRRWLKRSS